ncbi:hypothetical protein [Bradyrhizobium sp. Bra64]|uniref:hypothetical protein n=1 Tax=Bradyrhizobium sp. Bra64 TaxID=2926009 RepID=UPI002118917D|nr:hypothetical protein [Bradyrhizobium sp. Bra64]
MPVNQEIKRKVRAELFKSATAGKFLTYADFFDRMHPGDKMGSFPYTDHFDEIAKEERSGNYPDITFLVHRSGDAPQYPSQVDFRPFDPTDKKQLDSLRTGTDSLIALYCPPNTPNPYR